MNQYLITYIFQSDFETFELKYIILQNIDNFTHAEFLFNLAYKEQVENGQMKITSIIKTS